MSYDELWWAMMNYDDFMMNYDDFMMNYDDEKRMRWENLCL